VTQLPTTMTALRLHEPGGVDGLSLDTVPVPTPGDGEVLVRVVAAAITRDELTWPTDRLPAIPSYELAGTVMTAGADGPLRAGDEVLGMTAFDRDGVAAEYAAVPATLLVRRPKALDWQQAAALALPGLSALQGLVTHGRLRPGQRVLVQGGAGVVGGMAVQLARHLGAHVLATASGPRLAIARELGAHDVYDSSDDLARIEPVDLVFDTVGGERLARSPGVVRPGGSVVSINERPTEDAGSERGIESVFFVVEPDGDQLAELARLAETGDLRVDVADAVPLHEGAAAFARLDGGGAGKLVLTMATARR
jgi:NADPH:quinone reductase-like Zn-dependent oxidoreductase